MNLSKTMYRMKSYHVQYFPISLLFYRYLTFLPLIIFALTVFKQCIRGAHMCISDSY